MKFKILIFTLALSLCFLCFVIPSFAYDDEDTEEPLATSFPLTDLTDTVWQFHNILDSNNGTDFRYDINFTITGYDYDFTYLSLSTGSYYTLRFNILSAYRTLFGSSSSGWGTSETGATFTPSPPIITISGGNDSNNADLISWLFDNADLISPAIPETEIIYSGYRYQSSPPSSQLPPIPIPPDPSFLSVGVSYSYEAVGTYYLSNQLPYTFTHASWMLVSYTDSSNYILHFDVQRESGSWVTLYSFIVQSGSQSVVPFTELSYFVFTNDFEVSINWSNLFYSHFAPQLDDDEPTDFTDNPWLYILELVVDALHFPLWGYFSPWDIFTTVSGIFIVTWLLKLIAGG